MKSTYSLLLKKLGRTLMHGWKQFVALVAIGAIAMTLFIGFYSNAVSLANRVESVYEQGNMADIYVTTDAYESSDYDSISSLVKQDCQYYQIEQRSELSGLLAGSSSYCVIAPDISLDAMSISHPIEVNVLNEELHSDTNFFMIDETLYEENFDTKFIDNKATVSFSVSTVAGSYLTESNLETLDTFLKEGKTNPFRNANISFTFDITATMTHPENIATSSYNASIFYVDKLTVREKIRELIEENFLESYTISILGMTFNPCEIIEQRLGIDEATDANFRNPDCFPQTNQYLIKLNDTSNLETIEQNIREFFAAKPDTTGSDNNLVSVTDESTNPWSASADTDVRESLQICYVFPMVFFLTAILVILTTISQIIVKERGEIGTMKAIGLTNGEILGYYLTLTEILVFLASLIGCIIGPFLIPSIMGIKYDILYSLPARALFVFPWEAAIISVIAFMIGAGIVTFLVAWQEIKLPPVLSMRPKVIKMKKKAKTLLKKQNPLTLSVNMTFRNIKVNLVKSLMVVIGVMGCTALCVCGFGIDDTLNHGVDVELTTIYNADISVTYGYSGSFLEQIKAVENVVSAEEYCNSVSSLSSLEDDGSTRLTTSSMVHLYDDDVEHLKLDLPTDSDSVVISKKISETLGLNVGDTIRFTYNDVTYDKKVVSLAELFSSTGVFCHFSTLGIDPIYSSCWVDIAEGVDSATVSEALMQLEFVQSSVSAEELSEEITSVLSGISMMTTAIKAFAIVLAVVVLYNLALMNHRDRTRDIATLKVLGFRKGEIALSLVLETMVLTVIGALLGVAVGFPFMYAVLYVNRIPLVNFIYYIAPWSYVISFGISFVAGFVVSAFLAYLTDRVPMVESLKSVE